MPSLNQEKCPCGYVLVAGWLAIRRVRYTSIQRLPKARWLCYIVIRYRSAVTLLVNRDQRIWVVSWNASLLAYRPSCGSTLHNVDHKHCTEFGRHLALFATLGSRLDCNYDIGLGEQLALVSSSCCHHRRSRQVPWCRHHSCCCCHHSRSSVDSEDLVGAPRCLLDDG